MVYRKVSRKRVYRKRSVKKSSVSQYSTVVLYKEPVLPDILEIVPESVGKYPLLKLLGKGASGAVFETVLEDGSPAVIKIAVGFPGVLNENTGSIFIEKRFYTSARNIPYVPKFYDYEKVIIGKYEYYYIVFEKFKMSLSDFVEKKKKLTRKCIYGIGYRLFEAVRSLHNTAQRWMHLDIKPENIMLTDDKDKGISLIDFGVTNKLSILKVFPRCNLYGTTEFLGMHVFNLERESPRDELESVGYIIVWLLLGGNLPWMGKDVEEIRKQISDPDLPTRLAKLTKQPVLKKYFEIVRNLEIDEEIPYDKLSQMLKDNIHKYTRKGVKKKSYLEC